MAISVSENEADASRLPSDQLAGLPKSYDAVPQLGPPLPGDLGRPILKRQRGGDDGAAARLDDDDAAARKRAAADLQAARQSSLLAITAQKGGAEASAELSATSQVVLMANGPQSATPDKGLVLS